MWRGQGGRPALAKVLIRSNVWGGKSLHILISEYESYYSIQAWLSGSMGGRKGAGLWRSKQHTAAQPLLAVSGYQHLCPLASLKIAYSLLSMSS